MNLNKGKQRQLELESDSQMEQELEISQNEIQLGLIIQQMTATLTHLEKEITSLRLERDLLVSIEFCWICGREDQREKVWGESKKATQLSNFNFSKENESLTSLSLSSQPSEFQLEIFNPSSKPLQRGSSSSKSITQSISIPISSRRDFFLYN